MTNPLAAIVNDISDCLEALENETSTQGSAGDAVAERMRVVLPALLDGTEGTTISQIRKCKHNDS